MRCSPQRVCTRPVRPAPADRSHGRAFVPPSRPPRGPPGSRRLRTVRSRGWSAVEHARSASPQAARTRPRSRVRACRYPRSRSKSGRNVLPGKHARAGSACARDRSTRRGARGSGGWNTTTRWDAGGDSKRGRGAPRSINTIDSGASASASARHAPTGPPPMIATSQRSAAVSAIAHQRFDIGDRFRRGLRVSTSQSPSVTSTSSSMRMPML